MLILNAVKSGLKKSAKTIFLMVKIVVPVYFLVMLLDYTGILPKISSFFEPVMSLTGLPGGAAIVIIMGNFLNLYGGIAAMTAFTFTTKQITIIAMMLLICHSLPIETSVIKTLKIPRYKQIILRVASMLIIGILLNLLWR